MPMSYPVTATFVFQSAAAATGNGNVMDISELATLGIQVSGTFVGTITFEASIDRTNWVAPRMIDPVSATSSLATITEPGVRIANVTAFSLFRARISAYTSGAITIVGKAITLPPSPTMHYTALPNDGLASMYCLPTTNQALIFNGTYWDRERNNMDVTLLASAARTSTTSSADQVNYNGRGVLVTLNVTALAATPSVVLSIEAKMGAVYEALLTASAAVTATGIHSYLVYPGVGAASGDIVQVAGFPLPRTWRVTVTHGDADSITYVVNASVIL